MTLRVVLLQNREDSPLRILITNMRKILYRNRKLRTSIRSSKQKDYKVSLGPACAMQKRGGENAGKKRRKKEREGKKFMAKTANHESQFKFTVQGSTQNGFTI